MRKLKDRSNINIPVTEKEAYKIVDKIFKFAFIKILQCFYLDPISQFAILRDTSWRESYFDRIHDYEYLVDQCSKYQIENLTSHNSLKTIEIPSSLYYYAPKITEIPDAKFYKITGEVLTSINNTYCKTWDDIFVAEILFDLFNRGKINVELWNKAYIYCREKKVVRKFFKNTKYSFPESLDELPKEWDGEIPDKLPSYIRTAVYRYSLAEKDKIYKKKQKGEPPPIFQELSDLKQETDPKDHDISERFKEEDLIDHLNLVTKEKLTEKERSVITMRYFKEKLTQAEIGKRLKVTQQMINKLQQNAFNKYRKYLEHPKTSS